MCIYGLVLNGTCYLVVISETHGNIMDCYDDSTSPGSWTQLPSTCNSCLLSIDSYV